MTRRHITPRRALLCGLLALTAMVASARAAELPQIYIVAAEAATTHRSSDVWSGRFLAPNGELFNTARYYQSSGPLLSGEIVFATRPARVTPLIVFGFDAGYRAQIYKATPSSHFGLGLHSALSEGFEVSVLLKNIAHIGGNIRERACIDSFQRRYHCGTGAPWTDYQTHAFSHTRNHLRTGPKAHMRLRYRF